jgi:hypothetical protein
VRRVPAEALQWYGLLGAGLAWATQLVIGFGVAYAECSKVGPRWGIDIVTWEITLMVVGGCFALLAEAAAITVLMSTRGLEYDDPPPHGRRHFFAWAAALGNLLFLGAILLSGIGVISNATCRPV